MVSDSSDRSTKCLKKSVSASNSVFKTRPVVLTKFFTVNDESRKFLVEKENFALYRSHYLFFLLSEVSPAP